MMKKLCTRLLPALILSATPMSAAQSQSSDFNAADFSTETGICGQSELDTLSGSNAGSTYSLDSIEILTADGVNPAKTGTTIPPMVPLSCHSTGKNTDLVLVSSSKNAKFCGWVNRENLLQPPESNNRGNLADLLGDSDSSVCGDVAPMQVSVFCKRMIDLGQPLEACLSEPRLAKSEINAKFMVWNAELSSEESKANALQAPIYLTKRAEKQRGQVNLFSVLRIFDVAESEKGTLFLVGSNFRNMFGWIPQKSGTVWYSKLATFFSEDSNGAILSDEPAVKSAKTIAEVPPNLREMLSSEAAFKEYPVLFDRREQLAKDAFLEIAFLGRLCRENELCVDTGNGSDVDLDPLLEQADILFLIDGTKSMRRYFPLVSQAVRKVAAEEKGGSFKYRFGAAIYGDYLSKGNASLTAPMQFKMPFPLKPLRRGNELDRLSRTELYIEDPAGGYPEAMYSAIYNAIGTAKWRKDIPKFIIHLADHGDRGGVPSDLIERLRNEKIFYMPIAVQGDFRKKENGDFVKHAQGILAEHVTPNGKSIGFDDVIRTYRGNQGATDPQTEYNSIADAVRVSVNFAEELRREILADLLELDPGDVPSDNQLPGSAAITEAGLEIFRDKLPERNSSVSERTLAAKGYIPFSFGDNPDWRFSVAIVPGDLRPLINSYSSLCKYIFGTSADVLFVDNLKQLISKLTGDTLETNDEFKEYFSNRDSIPLVSRTILGEGILELGRTFRNVNDGDRLAVLQKEVCRTRTLLSQIEAGLKASKPFETKVINGNLEKGNLVWDEADRLYRLRNAKPHNWVVKDELGSSFIFIPLDYFPPKPKDIQ